MFLHGMALYAIVCVAYFSSRAPMFDPLVDSAIEELWHHYISPNFPHYKVYGV